MQRGRGKNIHETRNEEMSFVASVARFSLTSSVQPNIVAACILSPEGVEGSLSMSNRRRH